MMHRRYALSAFAVGLVTVCGCNPANQPQPNHFAATPVVHSSRDAERSTNPATLGQPSIERELRPNRSLGQSSRYEPEPTLQSDSLRQKCIDELRQQRPYRFDFGVQTIDGKRISKRDFNGRLLIVDLWATWCGPCKREIPHFIALQRKYKDAGLSIVGFNFERESGYLANVRKVQSFADSARINYPLVIGSEKISKQVPDFRAYPTTLFIDGNGKVRLTIVGARSRAELETFVQILLQDPSIDPDGVTLPTPMADSAGAQPEGPPPVRLNPFLTGDKEVP